VLDALSSVWQNGVLRFLDETELIQSSPLIISLKYASLRNFELAPPKILRPSSAAGALRARTAAQSKEACLRTPLVLLGSVEGRNLEAAAWSPTSVAVLVDRHAR